MRELIELIESRSELDVSKPWTMSGSQWLDAHNIHEPWIAEISPMQIGRMSDSERKRWQAKRSAEWQASSDGKNEWARAVQKAFENGKFKKDDATVHPDALLALTRNQARDEKERKEKMLAQARKDNEIASPSELKVGDKVFHLSGSYMEVKKIGKKTITLFDPIRKEDRTQVNLGWVRWLDVRDLEASLEGK